MQVSYDFGISQAILILLASTERIKLFVKNEDDCRRRTARVVQHYEQRISEVLLQILAGACVYVHV